MRPEQHVDPDISTLTTNSESHPDEASDNRLVLDSEPNSDSAELENEWSQPRRIAFQIAFVHPSTFRLTSRGFHWINEYPFNR